MGGKEEKNPNVNSAEYIFDLYGHIVCPSAEVFSSPGLFSIKHPLPIHNALQFDELNI